MIHGLMFGLGLCLAPVVFVLLLRGWRWIAAGVPILLAIVGLVIVHAVGLHDWRLVGLAWIVGSVIAFGMLPWLGFDPLRSALFLNAGLVALAVFMVQHTLPPVKLVAYQVTGPESP